MRIRKKGASLIEKSFLIIVVFTTTLNGQYYSEQMRQQQTLGSAVQEPLTLQEIQAEVSQPQAQLPPQGNEEASVWTYQAEPHLESLPLTSPDSLECSFITPTERYLSSTLIRKLFTITKGYDPETVFCQ